MPQFLRPNADIVSTNYTGGWAEINEVSPADEDLAYGATNSNTPTLVVSLTNPIGAPGGVTGTVRWRSARRNENGSLTAGNSFTATCTLLQGGMAIANDSYTAGNLSTRDFSFTLSEVSNFNDLRLQFNQTASGGNNANQRTGLAVTWAEVELPGLRRVTIIT